MIRQQSNGNRGDTDWALNDWSQGLHLPTGAAPFCEINNTIFMNKFEAQKLSGFIYKRKNKPNFLFLSQNINLLDLKIDILCLKLMLIDSDLR